MQDGIYRLYRYELENPRDTHLRLVSRFAIHNKELIILEDHIHLMSSVLPIDRLEQRLAQLTQNGYYKLENEEDIFSAEEPEALQEIDEKVFQPTNSFQIEWDGAEQPAQIDEFSDGTTLFDGRKLSPEQVAALQKQIEKGVIRVRGSNVEPN